MTISRYAAHAEMRRLIEKLNGKKGAAEWLRGIAREEYDDDGDSACVEIHRRLGVECFDVGRCRECAARSLENIADRIDADRELPEGVEWPRFEDGGLVGFGDEVEHEGETWKVTGVGFESLGFDIGLRCGLNIGAMSGSYGERLKRPTPKVLDADGVEIKVGDTVYFVGGSGTRFAVKDIDFKPDGGFVDIIDEDRYSATVNPESLTHERPDSWERLEEDAYHLVMSEYLETPEDDVRDIVRRAKALAKAGER